ncbi:YwmB family TATA-box binding protein [Paenibacillus sp. GCM10027626]|uniref:YwmB family TATA-box binding protein n=1 Tax=Paenibacillus sp. GCM10027626 TaxID=3273411 RepID=UPI00362D4DA7
MTLHAKQTSRKFSAGIALAVIVLLATAIYSLWNKEHLEQSVHGKTRLMHDFAAVWDWMDDVLADGAAQGRWSFRMDGRWSQEETARLAGALGVTLSAEPAAEKGALGAATAGQAYSGKTEIDGVYRTIVRYEAGAAVVLVQTDAGAAKSKLAELILSLEQAATVNKLDYAGSFAVRGEPGQEDAAAVLAGKAKAERREVYNDGHTESITYSSPELQTGVASGAATVNLQIADISGDAGAPRELVVGVPLITGDYRM